MNQIILKNKLLEMFKDAFIKNHPWISSADIFYFFLDNGFAVNEKDIFSAIEKLEKESLIDVESVFHSSKEKGFAARLSYIGRNKLMHSSY